MDKPQVFWITDSFKRESMHLNGPDLSFSASYMGHIECRAGEWFFLPKEGPENGPHSTPTEAKRAAMKKFDVEYVA